MATNEYDDLIAQGPASSGGGEYDNLIADDKSIQKSQVQQNMQLASRIEPDRKAEVMRLADQMNLPPNIVERNFDDLKKSSTVKGTDYDALVNNSPGLATFLGDKDHAALAQDDLPNLKKIEQTVQDHSMMTTMYNSLGSGLANMNSTLAKVPAAIYDAAAYPQNLMYQAMGSDKRVTSSDTFLTSKNAIAEKYSADAKSYQELEPVLTESVTEALGNRDWPRAGKIVAAQFVANAPQQALLIASALSGYGAAGLVGAGLTSTAEKNAANLDAGIDPVVGVPNAVATGSIESGFESIGTFGLLKTWEGAIAKSYGRSVSKEVMKDFVKTIGYSMLGEGNEEMLTSFAQDFTDYISGVNPDAMKGAFGRGLDAGIIGGFSGAMMTGPSAIASGVHQSSVAQANKEFYLSLGESAQATKLKERMPKAQQTLIEQITQGTPVENVYIPAETIESYFQSQKINPVTFMHEVGSLESFEEAKARGGDVKIPLAQWVNKVVGTPYYQGLADDVRLSDDVNSLSVNEHKALAEQLQTEASDKVENVKDAEKMQKDRDAHEHIVTNIKDQISTVKAKLESMGQSLPIPEDQIEAYANVQADRYMSRAEAQGVEASELYAKEPLIFQAMLEDSPSEDGQSYDQGRVKYEVKHKDGSYTVAPGGEKQHATGRIVGNDFQIDSFAHDPKQERVSTDMLSTLADLGLAGNTTTISAVATTPEAEAYLKKLGFEPAPRSEGSSYGPQRMYKALTADAWNNQTPKYGEFKVREDMPQTVKVTTVDATTEASQVKTISQARDYATNNLRGRSIRNEQTNMDVDVSSKGLKEVARPNSKDRPGTVLALTHLDSLIKNAVYEGSEAEAKGKPGVFRYHRFYAPMRAKGKEYLVRIKVSETENGKKFYHEVGIESERPLGSIGEQSPNLNGRTSEVGPNQTMLPASTAQDSITINDFAEAVNATRKVHTFFQSGRGIFQTEVPMPESVSVVSNEVKVGSVASVRADAIKRFKSKSFVNAHTGWDISIGRNGIGKASGTLSSEGNRAALGNLDKLIQAAVYVRKEIDRTGHDNDLYVFYAPLNSAGKEYIVKLVVREADGKKFYDKFAIEKEITATGATPDQTGAEVTGKALPHSMSIDEFVRDVKSVQAADPFFQEGARGRIFLTPMQRIIQLGPKADFSTLIHESGHAWLDEMRQDYAQALSIDQLNRTAAQQQLAEDGEAILKWLGVDTFQDIKVDQHEQWARGVEAYFMEGKAPTKALAKAFANFKVWLINIYKKLSSLNVELSPEIRDVMTRMITIQEQVEQAKHEQGLEPLFGLNPEKFGLTGDKAKRYLEASQRVKDAAEEEVMTALMKGFQRQREQFYKEQRRNNRERFEADVNQMPVYKALSLMQKGELADGTSLDAPGMTWKLSKEILNQQFDPELVKRLPRGISVKETSEGMGLHPDVVAEMLGFNSGAELIHSLTKAEKKSVLIERLTDEHMKRAYPDLIDNPEGVKKQAMEAMHKEPRSKLLRLELEYLASEELPAMKDVITQLVKRMPTEKAVRAQAEKIIMAKPVGEIKPHLFLRAERAAAKESAKALTQGDRTKAWEAKRRELLNHELYRAAVAANELVEKTIEKSKRFFKPDEKMAKTRDMDLINSGRATLSLFGLGKVDKPAQSYIEPIKQYDPEMYETIISLTFAASQGAGNYKTITQERFEELAHTLQAIWDLSKSNKQIEIDGIKRNREEIQGELQMRLLELTSPEAKAGYEQAATTWDKVKLGLMGMKSAVTRVETWVDVMDAGNPKGPFRTYLWQPISEAIDRYKIAKTSVLGRYLNDVLQPIAKSLTTQKIDAKEINYTFKDKAELLAAMLHTGNDSNMQKLLLGRNWGQFKEDETLDRSKWDRFQKRMIDEGKLTKADFDYVQGVWDLLEELKPLAQKAHKAMYGTYFNEVTANSFETPFGTYRGGYMPAVADQFINQDASLRAQREALESGANQKMFPTTGRGFTKAREQKYNAPLSLELSLVPMHIDKVLRFVHVEPRVKEVSRITMDRNFNTALNAVDSTINESMLTPWLERSAKQQMTKPSTGRDGRALDTIAKALRRRTGLSAMVGNLTNALQQLPGIGVAAIKVKPKHLRQGLMAYMAGPSVASADIADKSEFMRSKLDGQLQIINQTIEDLTLNPNKFQTMRAYAERHGYFFQRAMQNVVDITVWTGAYNQAVENGADERGAVREADSAIRQTQDAQTPESVSKFETGAPFVRLFTQYAGWFNMLGNLNAGEATKIIREIGLKKGAGSLFYVYTLGFMVPAVMSELLTRLMSGKGFDEDDDDQYMDDFLALFFGSQARLATAMFPGVGPVINSGIGRFTSAQYDDRISTSPALSSIENTISGVTLQGLRQGNANKQIRDTLTALSMFSGMPLAPLAKPITYLNDVSSGKAQPSGPIDFSRGFITGKTGSKN